MNSTQQRGLALGSALLTALICFGFMPAPLWLALLLWLGALGMIAFVWYIANSHPDLGEQIRFDHLPEPTYRQPIVLVSGDLPQAWPEGSSVLTVTQGCWIRVEPHQDVEQVAKQILSQRPDWGPQLSVMVSVCPQQHSDTESLSSRLLMLRWQLNQLRKSTGYRVPLVLSGQIGSAMITQTFWQVATVGEEISIWRDNLAPSSLSSWLAAEGSLAMQQQVLVNSLISWFEQHVTSVFTDEHPDINPVLPTAVLWGIGPTFNGNITSSVWHSWLSRNTAMQQVAGWQPVDKSTEQLAVPLFPNFILPLLPKGLGLTPSERAWRCGLNLFTSAAIIALLCSGWNNRQLLQSIHFDVTHYEQISMDDYAPKAEALNTLRQDAEQLDLWARSGEPMNMGLGLYLGERLRLPVLESIRNYIPAPKPKPKPKPQPQMVRLDSISLFDSGKSMLKAGSTKMLVNSLVGIKAKPGWLIVVAGHTDNTGDETLNQILSLKRAKAVRDWMRDTGDVPESCFAVQGYGESRPVATNDTPEGRTLNRRVEITLVPQANACLTPENIQASLQNYDALQQNGE